MKTTYQTYEEYNEAIKDFLPTERFFITLCNKRKGIFRTETFKSEEKFNAAVSRRRG